MMRLLDAASGVTLTRGRWIECLGGVNARMSNVEDGIVLVIQPLLCVGTETTHFELSPPFHQLLDICTAHESGVNFLDTYDAAVN